MRLSTITSLALLASLAVASSSRAAAPGSAGMFGSLKLGQWIQLEGTPQRDGTVLCTEAKILTGDLLEDDWNVNGVVRSIDKEKKRLFIHNLPIRLSDRAEFDSPDGRLTSFSGIKTGMLIDAEGTFLKDGTFVAKELEDETEKLKRKPEYSTKIQFVGRIDKLDASRRTISLMGTTFIVTDRTRVKSVIK